MIGEIVYPTKGMKKYFKWILAFVYSALFLNCLFGWYSERVNQNISDSMIRLHIVANSDSSADQSLKYDVRDEIVTYMNEQRNLLQSKEDAGGFIRENLGELERVAKATMKSHGSSDPVRVSFGKYPFPTKQYANMVLPAGFYDAVKIEIGEAAGQNWWCVMFPPLCFVEDTQGELDEEYISLLQEELSEDEMEMILGSGSEEEIPVEIKFRIVELFQESKIKLAGLFRGIIKIN